MPVEGSRDENKNRWKIELESSSRLSCDFIYAH